ncbi:MAG: metallophosphoesterase [Angelakisella sp.]
MITNTIIKRVVLPEGRRIICISDIHGHLNYLKALLQKVSFSKEDILIIVGDLIERGVQNVDTIRFLMELQNTHTVYVLMGNVDGWMMECFQEDSPEPLEQVFEELCARNQTFGGSLFAEVSHRLGMPLTCPQDIPAIRTAFQTRMAAEYQYLLSLPTVLDTQGYTFVHGGIPTCNLARLDMQAPFEYLKNDNFVAKGFVFDKYVIVGHWPAVLQDKTRACHLPNVNEAQHIISIDGGCGVKPAGQLNALIIPYVGSQEFSFAYWDDLPTAVAVTPQQASEMSINITYSDSAIKILKRDEEFSYGEHLSSGYRLWIENSYICDIDSAEPYCPEYTDYLLPVSVGDRLSVIKRTSRGYHVKKGGVEGWYKGTLKE